MKAPTLSFIAVLLVGCATGDGGVRESAEQGIYTVREYDERRDLYVTRTKEIYIDVSLAGDREISAYYLTDKNGNTVSDVTLTLIWLHLGYWGWKDVDKVHFLADGKEFQYPALYEMALGRGIREQVSLDIPREEFISLVNFSSLTARIGATEIQFAEEHLDVFRELAAGMSRGGAGER